MQAIIILNFFFIHSQLQILNAACRKDDKESLRPGNLPKIYEPDLVGIQDNVLF